MLKATLAFIVACTATVFIVGCNGSDSDVDRIIGRIQSLLSDANEEDISETMENYALDYCDDVDFCGGGTYQDERDCWLNTFNANTNVRFSDLRVQDVQVNQNKTEGYIDAVVHFVVLDQFGTIIGEDDYAFRMWMINANGTWLMWGDGNCVDGTGRTPPTWRERIGKPTKAGSPATRTR
jgi:hypothetical protein